MTKTNCIDHNRTPLHIGDSIMCMANGNENEGTITKTLNNNHIEIDGEHGIEKVNANNCYYLP